MLTESCKSTIETPTSLQKQVEAESLPSGTYKINTLQGYSNSMKKAKITFNSDGTISGSTGCNCMFGNYRIDGNTITFKGIGASKKYCPEVSKSERLLLKALNSTTNFSIGDNMLTLSNVDGLLIKAVPVGGASEQKKISEHYYTTSVSYKALGRGYFEFIEVSEDKVSIASDANLKDIKTYKSTNKKDWASVEAMIKSVNLSNLNNLKAPTNKRLYDGAASATLTIRTGDMIVTSSAFDHEHPPKEIEALVNKVLSIKENSTKE